MAAYLGYTLRMKTLLNLSDCESVATAENVRCLLAVYHCPVKLHINRNCKIDVHRQTPAGTCPSAPQLETPMHNLRKLNFCKLAVIGDYVIDKKSKKVKERIVLREIHLRTTGRHLSLGWRFGLVVTRWLRST